MEVTVHTLKGIHTFRKDHNTQTSSLRRKMKDYIEEYQNIINPHASNRENTNRPSPSPFPKKSKITLTKRSYTETKCNIKKLYKPRRVAQEML